jgi:hypothetical protein
MRVTHIRGPPMIILCNCGHIRQCPPWRDNTTKKGLCDKCAGPNRFDRQYQATRRQAEVKQQAAPPSKKPKIF